MNKPIIAFLSADGPHPDLGDNADLYGQFIGSWDIDNHQYDEGRGEWSDSREETHFGWVLGGRAVQDLWGSPERGFGTTLRAYDPAIDAWRVEFMSPVWDSYCSLIGRAAGERIVQDGARLRSAGSVRDLDAGGSGGGLGGTPRHHVAALVWRDATVRGSNRQ